MLKLAPPDYRYCPFCSKPLSTRTEESHQRRYCPACNWTYYPRVASSVSAIICDNHQTLLVKRRRAPFKGTWMFPSGFVDFGEHPDDTLAREVKEETGLTLQSANLLGVFQSDDDFREFGQFVFFYRVTAQPGDLQNDDHENEAIGWFPVSSPPEIGLKHHRHFMQELAKGRLPLLG